MENKFPKVFKRKWIKALRSGEFKQGEGSLKIMVEDNGYQYCCLGVAAEVAGCTGITNRALIVKGIRDKKYIKSS